MGTNINLVLTLITETGVDTRVGQLLILILIFNFSQK
jgi:hypothetical protein